MEDNRCKNNKFEYSEPIWYNWFYQRILNKQFMDFYVKNTMSSWNKAKASAKEIECEEYKD